MQFPLLAIKFLLSLSGTPGGSFITAQSTIMPVVAAALLLDSTIVGIWYLLGVVLSNDRVKSSARSEMYQLVGTIILAMILIGFMTAWGNMFFNILGKTNLMKPATMDSLCQNIMGTTQLYFLGGPSNPKTPGVNSILSGNPTGTVFEGICGIVHNAANGGGTLTEQIDYPIAAAATILANVTNQTATNLNSAFTFDAFVGFMTFLKPSSWVCISATGLDSQCFLPVAEAAPATFEFEYYFQPFSGYDLLLTNLGTLGTLLTTALEMCTAQLNFIVICLYIWPFLLFIGLVLRSTLFTRPLGGLFIAIALTIVLVFPAIYAIEYLSLANPDLTTLSATYNFNPTPALQTGSTASGTYGGDYTINFFVQPNMENIIINNGCWPEGIGNVGGLAAAEAEDIGSLLFPGYSIVTGIIGLATTGAPNIILPSNSGCQSPQVLSIFFQLLNAYGIMGIDIYILPLLNIIITITAMRGLSGLMGGDTELAGLARLVP